MPAGFEGNTQAGSARLPSLDADTTYYWRVRATKPALSPWSAVSSFTTGLGAAIVAPELYSPKAGAEGVSLKPLFQWSAIAGASSYEFILAANVSFSNPVIMKTGADALPATAWQNETSLEYDTAYYWKVRASGSSSHSDWSAVGAFITQAPPASPAPAAEPPSPPPTAQPPQPTPIVATPTPSPSPPLPPQAQSGLPGWFPFMMGGVLLAIVMLAVAILILVVKMRRA
ncbi:MAG: fibronectin type III domain-containing protein [Chloroflexi bacterium]|nr:fibronectin type III domain-containing protein [Chloroflexota bacterium]